MKLYLVCKPFHCASCILFEKNSYKRLFQLHTYLYFIKQEYTIRWHFFYKQSAKVHRNYLPKSKNFLGRPMSIWTKSKRCCLRNLETFKDTTLKAFFPRWAEKKTTTTFSARHIKKTRGSRHNYVLLWLIIYQEYW